MNVMRIVPNAAQEEIALIDRMLARMKLSDYDRNVLEARKALLLAPRRIIQI